MVNLLCFGLAMMSSNTCTSAHSLRRSVLDQRAAPIRGLSISPGLCRSTASSH